MTTKHIREALAEAPKKSGDTWRVIVARPGQGSSGNYSEEMFRRDAEKLIHPGAQAFINHDKSRNPKDMIGTYPDGAHFDEDEKAVVADLKVFSHWQKFVEEVGPHCGISLYAIGKSDDEGNVTEIIEHSSNGADLVARPGLEGSKLDKLYETALAESANEPHVAVAEENGNKGNMEKADQILAKVTELVTLLSQKATAEADEATARAEAAAQAEADATAVAEGIDKFDAARKAVDEAELLESQRESILAAAKTGADVTPLIESAKALRDEAIKAAEAAAEVALAEAATGRVIGRKVESAIDLGKVLA